MSHLSQKHLNMKEMLLLTRKQILQKMNIHRENGGTLEMVPSIINPIYTLDSWYLLGISPFKGLLGVLNS